jgi:hypothetical protein
MKRTSILFGILWMLSVCCVIAMVAAEDKKPYTPSEVQKLRLEVKQKDTQLAQLAMRESQRNFSMTLKSYTEEADKVKKENQWPDNLQFNPDTMLFTDPPAPPKPAEPKPAEKKP